MINSRYTITQFEYGVIVKGFIPCNVFFELQELFEKTHGYDYIDDKIGIFFKATLCMTTRENSIKWRRFINTILFSGMAYNVTTTNIYENFRCMRRSKRSRSL